jgi:N-acetylglucosamine-6-phosphate deacetylase
MKTLLLKNADVVLPDRVLKNASVSVVEGKIASIGAAVGGEEIDLAGATLLPGFIDVHIHGAVGVDVMDATSEGLREVSEYLASQGVTTWLPTLVPAADENYASVIATVLESSQKIEQAQEIEQVRKGGLPPLTGAHIAGIHYEGPFVNSAQCGALHSEYFKTYSSPSDLEGLPVLPDAVRMITLAPEINGGVELISELKRRGWVISIGHTRADLKVLDEACDAGARHMTHFMNAMSPLHHRKPGPVAWGLSRDDVTFDVVADGIHLDPFVLRLLLKMKGTPGISLISDAIAATGKGDGDYEIWGETISVKNGRTANAAGSIAGSVISMLDAVRLLHSLGVSYVDLARMASSNPAQLLGLDPVCGSIEPGKRADLVALDHEGNVKLTLTEGTVTFTS